MKHICLTCGREFERTFFHPYTTVCGSCKAKWPWQGLPAADSIFQFVTWCHLPLLFCFLIPLPALDVPEDVYSILLVLSGYCLIICLYFMVRRVIGKRRGFPVLSRWQKVGYLLLPAYGPALVFLLFLLGQGMRYGFHQLRVWW